MSDDEYLTVAEIAELLKVNPQTVRNTIDRGDLLAVRFGRRVRVRRTDLDRYLVYVGLGGSSKARRRYDEAIDRARDSLRRDSRHDAAAALSEVAAAAEELAREFDSAIGPGLETTGDASPNVAG